MPAFVVSRSVTGEFPSHLSKLHFSMLCISTILIAAAGYILNDIFDRKTDEINKPGYNQIGRLITEKSAQLLVKILFALGIVLGFYIAYVIDKPFMGLIQVFSAASLYMYSSFYQKRVLSGNILIALLTALSLLTVGLFEPNFYPNFIYLLWYAGFAFTLTLVREVVKDMEDIAGDAEAQYETFPVRYGIKAGKRLALFFILLTIAWLIYILYFNFYDNNVINFWYLLAMVLIPILALAYLIAQAEEKKDFTYASLFTKLIMIGGTLSMIGFWYYFLR